MILFRRFFIFICFPALLLMQIADFLYQYSLRFTIRVKKEDAICEK